MDYTTTADIKTYLRISSSSDDLLLDDLVTRASRLIDNLCGRQFYATSATRTYDATGDHISGPLLLLDADLLTLTTITNGDGSPIPTDAVVLRPLNMRPYFGVSLKRGSGYRWTYDDDPQAAIAITGSWGYSSTPPEVIQQAATRLAAWLYRQRDMGMEALQVTVNERGQAAAPPRLPYDILDMLRPYTRYVFK